MLIYHGSDHIIDKPKFGVGKEDNDYGSGFYTTEDIEKANEWAALNGTDKAYTNKLGEHLLKLSKQKNNSDEISVTINIKENNKIIDGMDKILQKVGLCYGTKDETLLFSDPLTMHLVRGATDIAVVNLHNHPSCSPHSTLDLSFFLRESAVKMMIILGNNGELYYLSKTEKYNHDLARRYLTQAAYVVKPNVKETDKFTAMELRQVADLFLKNCYQFGIEYNHVLGTNRFLEETKNEILNNNIEEEDIDYDR